jgi:nucleoside-diphosphate kinase
MERTLVLAKPDAVQRSLVGEIISRLEARGLRITGLKVMQMTNEQAQRHYQAHKDRPFFQGLVSFISSGPLVAMVFEGNGAIALVRRTMGETAPADSASGTIRGDLAVDIGRNLIHGSDSPEAAAQEIPIFFEPSELVDYTRDIDSWITES